MVFVFAAAIAPALALFSYFYLRRQLPAGPLKHLLRTFLFGAFLSFPILFLQHVFQAESLFTSAFAESVLFSPLLEEFFKWFALVVSVWRPRELEDPYDGLLHGVALSLGFATVENILYLLAYGVQEAVVRALLPVSSHALFGVFMGYFVGRACYACRGRHRLPLALAFAVPLTLHAGFNLLLFSGEIGAVAVALYVIGMWALAIAFVKRAHRESEKERLKKHKYYEA